MAKKYRIKIITYKNGRRGYWAQVKKGWFWLGLNFDGSIGGFEWQEIQTALDIIDKHFKGNNTKQTIEFGYINKP